MVQAPSRFTRFRCIWRLERIFNSSTQEQKTYQVPAKYHLGIHPYMNIIRVMQIHDGKKEKDRIKGMISQEFYIYMFLWLSKTKLELLEYVLL